MRTLGKCKNQKNSSVKINSSLINLPDFQPPFRRDRSDRCGGGVAVYVRTSLPVVHVDFHRQLETVCIQLRLPRRKTVYMATVYRPPKGDLSVSDFVNCLESGLDGLHRSASSTVCLVGDFRIVRRVHRGPINTLQKVRKPRQIASCEVPTSTLPSRFTLVT